MGEIQWDNSLQTWKHYPITIDTPTHHLPRCSCNWCNPEATHKRHQIAESTKCHLKFDTKFSTRYIAFSCTAWLLCDMFITPEVLRIVRRCHRLNWFVEGDPLLGKSVGIISGFHSLVLLAVVIAIVAIIINLILPSLLSCWWEDDQPEENWGLVTVVVAKNSSFVVTSSSSSAYCCYLDGWLWHLTLLLTLSREGQEFENLRRTLWGNHTRNIWSKSVPLDKNQESIETNGAHNGQEFENPRRKLRSKHTRNIRSKAVPLDISQFLKINALLNPT